MASQACSAAFDMGDLLKRRNVSCTSDRIYDSLPLAKGSYRPLPVAKSGLVHAGYRPLA